VLSEESAANLDNIAGKAVSKPCGPVAAGQMTLIGPYLIGPSPLADSSPTA
jgi:hypothetical protein